MSEKSTNFNTMKELRVSGFADGYHGRDAEKPKNFYYMHGFATGLAQAHRQRGESEAYELECLYRSADNLSMEEAVKFSERFHRFYDTAYYGHGELRG